MKDSCTRCLWPMVLALASTCLPLKDAVGQSTWRRGPSGPANLAEQSLRESGLEPTPFAAEALGLQINLPLGSAVVAEKIDGSVVVTVTDSQQSPTWTLRIQSIAPSMEQPSAAKLVDDMLRDYQAQKTPFRVLSNTPVSYGGIDGQLCYVQRTSEQGHVYVTGRLVLPTGIRTFMVFAVQTLPEHLTGLRKVLESSFATLRLQSADEIASQRAARFQAGKAFLDSLTPEVLKQLAGQSQWHRIYKPDPKSGGASQEIGYSLVEVLEAPKGSMSEGRPEASYTTAERQEGLLVRVQARLVVDAKRRDFYDSIAQYWMAWDQSEEIWSIRGTRRQGDAEQSESESGVRERQTLGSLRPKLMVIKRTDTTEPVSYQWEVPECYLSQALGWLVGRLIPKHAAQPADFGFYYFVSSNLTPKLYQRLDNWSHDGTNWVLQSSFVADSPPFTSWYGSDGKLIRRTHADGTVTEPIDLEQLHKLWKSKGLQIKSGSK